MKKYFGLSSREENLVVYNTFFNSFLNSILVVPVVYFGYLVIKQEGLKSLFVSATANSSSNVLNYSIIAYVSFKMLSFLFETYYVGKASLNLIKDKNHNNF